MEIQAVAQNTRDEIIDAALRCFTQRGFAATTIDQIRAESGASVGSIYHHFGSKEEIAGSLYVEGLAAYQRGLISALHRAPGAEEGVRAIVRYHLRWVSGSNRDLAAFLMNRRETEVALASDDEVRELNRKAFAAVTAWYDGHADAGTVRPLPFDLLYAVVLGPAQEFTRHWLAGNTATSISRAERGLADAAWAAVRDQGDKS
jgi:AcrR family transcriptional regulator